MYQCSAKKYQIFEFTEDEVEKIIPPGRNRCKIDTPNTQIHDHSPSWLDTVRIPHDRWVRYLLQWIKCGLSKLSPYDLSDDYNSL